MYDFGTEEFVRQMCCTPEQSDPTKPLILRGEMVEVNPDFSEEAARDQARRKEVERRRTGTGTSFFLNFDPLCGVHQIDGFIGSVIRDEIVRKLVVIFKEVFVACLPEGAPDVEEPFWQILQVNLCPYAQPGFNNGEIYFWLRALPLTEDFAFKILATFKKAVDENLVKVTIEDEEHEVCFYGCGLRYI